MSASKYRWTPACDGQPCVGDCDLCRVDNLQSGIYTDNPDDTLRYVQTTVPVFDHWGYEKKQDDYVQVVRCKDCKYYYSITEEKTIGKCCIFDGWSLAHENDFYSRGKRNDAHNDR